MSNPKNDISPANFVIQADNLAINRKELTQSDPKLNENDGRPRVSTGPEHRLRHLLYKGVFYVDQ